MMKSKFLASSSTKVNKESKPTFEQQLQKIIEESIQKRKEEIRREGEIQGDSPALQAELIESMESFMQYHASQYLANRPGIDRILNAIERKYGKSIVTFVENEIFNADTIRLLSSKDVTYLVIETEKMCHQSGLNAEEFKVNLSKLAHQGISLEKEIEEKNRRLQERAARLQKIQAENEVLKSQLGLTTKQDETDPSNNKPEGKWAEFTKKLDATKKRDAADAHIDSASSADRKQAKKEQDEQSISSDDEKTSHNTQSISLKN